MLTDIHNETCDQPEPTTDAAIRRWRIWSARLGEDIESMVAELYAPHGHCGQISNVANLSLLRDRIAEFYEFEQEVLADLKVLRGSQHLELASCARSLRSEHCFVLDNLTSAIQQWESSDQVDWRRGTQFFEAFSAYWEEGLERMGRAIRLVKPNFPDGFEDFSGAVA